jgi:hypothetical protein
VAKQFVTLDRGGHAGAICEPQPVYASALMDFVRRCIPAGVDAARGVRENMTMSAWID